MVSSNLSNLFSVPYSSLHMTVPEWTHMRSHDCWLEPEQIRTTAVLKAPDLFPPPDSKETWRRMEFDSVFRVWASALFYFSHSSSKTSQEGRPSFFFKNEKERSDSWRKQTGWFFRSVWRPDSPNKDPQTKQNPGKDPRPWRCRLVFPNKFGVERPFYSCVCTDFYSKQSAEFESSWRGVLSPRWVRAQLPTRAVGSHLSWILAGSKH